MLDILKILGRRAVLASFVIGMSVSGISARAQTAPAAEGPMVVANRTASDCLMTAKVNADAKARGNAVHQCMRQWIAAAKSQPPPLATNRVPNN